MRTTSLLGIACAVPIIVSCTSEPSTERASGTSSATVTQSAPTATQSAPTAETAGASPQSASGGTTPEVATSAAAPAPPPVVMDNFVGRSYEEALKSLVPYNVQITRQARIAPQPAGTVVDQVPLGGSSFSQNVTLVVSVAPPIVPNVINKSFGEAETQLKQLGFAVVEKPTFEEERLDGLVVGQDPASGSRNVGEVQLTVVRRPVVAFISDLDEVATLGTANVRSGSAKANGTTYSHAVQVITYPGSGSTSVEYDLSRQYRRLIGNLGVSDDSSSDASYKVEIFGDGRALASETVTLGRPRPLDLDVTKVLRLRLTVTGLAGSSSTNDTIVFGDLRAQGLQSEVTSGTPTPSP